MKNNILKLMGKYNEVLFFYLGNILFLSLTLIFGILIAREYSISALGTFSYYLSINSLIMLTLGGGIRVTLTSDTSFRYTDSTYFIVRILYLMIGICVVVFTYKYNSFELLFIALALYKLVESVFDFVNGYYQRNNNKAKTSELMRNRALILLFLFFSTILLSLDLYYVFFILSLTSALLLVFDLQPILKKMDFTFIYKDVFTLFINVFLVSSTVFFVGFGLNYPKIYLGSVGGDLELGEFTSVMNFVMVASVLFSIYAQFLLPNLSESKSNRVKLLVLILTISVLTWITVFFYKPLLKIIYGSESSYGCIEYILSMLYLTQILCLSYINYNLISLNKTKVQAFYNFIGSLMLVLFLWLLNGVFISLGNTFTVLIAMNFSVFIVILLSSIFIYNHYKIYEHKEVV